MRRRAAIEPVIGHLKEDHRMGRNYLTGRDGDRINAVLAAAGYNFSLLLRWFEELLRVVSLILCHALLAGPLHLTRCRKTFFTADSLEPGADAIIADFAKTILTDRTVRSIVIVGHTDSIGADQYNETLSLKRATTVAKALQMKGVSEKVLGMVPMGEAQPVATNSTEQGRAQNRRVEFFISNVPAATTKAIERIKFNPCHRNDHDPAARQEDCGAGPMRIPVHYLSGTQTTLDLTRGALPVEPRVRARLPSEILQRPSIRELQQP